jgi:hypothetical protein
VERTRKRLRSQCGGDQLTHDSGIEGIAGQTDAAVAEQILRFTTSFTYARANVKQGKVAGAAAKVADKDELVVIQSGFVGVSRCNRFQFKIDPVKARFGKGLTQAGKGECLILFGLSANKTNRPAHHGITDGGTELSFGLAAQIGEEAGNQILESAMAAEHRRSRKRAIG